jgi:IclR family acetate operon transcriptional repressor
MTLDGNAVRSVDRAAALLLALGESQGEAGVTELARRLGLHKSTASRLLATLQKRGLVEQDEETGKYRLGLVVIRLAERAEKTLDLRGIAMPELERLARLTHETTGLGVLDGESLLTVAQADGPNLIAVGDWTGRATPLHCVASGKVLLAALAEREVLRIVRRGLISFTERTIVELEPLLEELARIRRRGYATALGEYEIGLNAVAAPVHDARGAVIAAVDIWGPAFRLTPRRIPELAAQARDAAAAISVRLGGASRSAAPTPVAVAASIATHVANGNGVGMPPQAAGSDVRLAPNGVAGGGPGAVAGPAAETGEPTRTATQIEDRSPVPA